MPSQVKDSTILARIDVEFEGSPNGFSSKSVFSSFCAAFSACRTLYAQENTEKNCFLKPNTSGDLIITKTYIFSIEHTEEVFINLFHNID